MIVGPTAGGKTAAGVVLCRLLQRETGQPGEVVTCDAFQVYKGMDIGTAKPTLEERDGIVHHCLDLVEPAEAYSVQRWLEDAEAAIADIRSRGRVPVVVGGTHLFVKALLDGLFEGPPGDAALRDELHAMDPAERRAELERVDPAAAGKIHFNDARRTVRALEVFRLTGTPLSEHQAQWDTGEPRADVRLVGLDWSAEALNQRINKRVKLMVEEGFVEEARSLFDAGVLGPQAREALGYKQLISHFEGRISLDDALEKTKIETRRFGKNQRTWLRRLRSTPRSLWIDAENMNADQISQNVYSQVFTGTDS